MLICEKAKDHIPMSGKACLQVSLPECHPHRVHCTFV